MAGFFPEMWGSKTLYQIKKMYEKTTDLIKTIVDYTPLTLGTKATSYHGPILGDLEVVDMPASVYQDPSKQAITINFNQKKGCPFKVNDIEQAQSNIAMRDELTEKAASALIKGWNRAVSDLAQTSVEDENNIEIIGTTLAYDDILKVAEMMDEAEIPQDERYMLVSPAHKKALMKIEEFISRDKIPDTNAVKTGVIGEICGFTVIPWKTKKVDSNGKFVGTKDKNASVFYSKLAIGFGRQKEIGAMANNNPLAADWLVNLYNVFGLVAQIPEYIIQLRDKTVSEG